MIRIRFHGRGGHGTKTASRVVGSAAFLRGFHAQDSPVYGAERRGAAVVAFTRIDQCPILERGAIERPHFIVLADETLFDTPEAHVLVGQEFCAGIFVNTTDAAALQDKYKIEKASSATVGKNIAISRIPDRFEFGPLESWISLRHARVNDHVDR